MPPQRLIRHPRWLLGATRRQYSSLATLCRMWVLVCGPGNLRKLVTLVLMCKPCSKVLLCRKNKVLRSLTWTYKQVLCYNLQRVRNRLSQRKKLDLPSVDVTLVKVTFSSFVLTNWTMSLENNPDLLSWWKCWVMVLYRFSCVKSLR